MHLLAPPGHCVSDVRGKDGVFRRYDDMAVYSLSEQQVFALEAQRTCYVLIYARDDDNVNDELDCAGGGTNSLCTWEAIDQLAQNMRIKIRIHRNDSSAGQRSEREPASRKRTTETSNYGNGSRYCVMSFQLSSPLVFCAHPLFPRTHLCRLQYFRPSTQAPDRHLHNWPKGGGQLPRRGEVVSAVLVLCPAY